MKRKRPWVKPPAHLLTLSKVTHGVIVSSDTHQSAKAVVDAYRVLGDESERLFGPEDLARLNPKPEADPAAAAANPATDPAAAAGGGGASDNASESGAESDGESEEQEQQQPAAAGTAYASLADELDNELKDLKKKPMGDKKDPKEHTKRRFTAVKTNVEGLVMIACQDPVVNVYELVESLMQKQLQDPGNKLARFIYKIRPAMARSKATIEDIEKFAEKWVHDEIIERYKDVYTPENPVTFSISLTLRNNDQLRSEHRQRILEVISRPMLAHRLAGDAKAFKVDLKHAQITVTLDVMGLHAFWGLTKDFEKRCQYNLQQIFEKHIKATTGKLPEKDRGLPSKKQKTTEEPPQEEPPQEQPAAAE